MDFAQVAPLPITQEFRDALIHSDAQQEVLVRRNAVQAVRSDFVGRKPPPANNTEPSKGITRQMCGDV